MIKHYCLRPNRPDSVGVVIEDDDGILCWVDWMTTSYVRGKIKKEETPLKLRIGPAKIREDILILYPPKTKPENEFATWAEVVEYQLSLPRWLKTKYFLSATTDAKNLRYTDTCETLHPDKAIGILTELGLWHHKK